MQQQMLPQQPGVVVTMPNPQMLATVQPGQPLNARPVAWEYPFKGMAHFISHPGLWIYAVCPLVCMFFAIIFATGLVLSRADAQYEFLHNYWGCQSWLCTYVAAGLVAALLCLVEVAIVTVAFLQISLAIIFEKVFIQTMKNQGVWQGDNASFSCSDEIFWAVVQLVFGLCTFWMNFIPVLGTILYAACNGALVAWEYHEFYFNMCGIGKREQRHEIWAHKDDYLSFGLVANLLLLVPFIGPLTFVTSVCGAAVWAAELEVRGCRPAGAQQQQQQQIAPMRQDEMQGLAMGAGPMIVQQPMGMVPAAAQVVQPQQVVVGAYAAPVASAPQPAHVVQDHPPPPSFEKQEGVAAAAAAMMNVTVPAGLQPGQTFSFQDPGGRTLQMTVPPNVFGGQTIQVQA